MLSALGVDFELGKDDLAARINFATIDRQGVVTDRRAGRISNELNRRLCDKLRAIRVPGVEIFLETESEHRRSSFSGARTCRGHCPIPILSMLVSRRWNPERIVQVPRQPPQSSAGSSRGPVRAG